MKESAQVEWKLLWYILQSLCYLPSGGCKVNNSEKKNLGEKNSQFKKINISKVTTKNRHILEMPVLHSNYNIRLAMSTSLYMHHID